jgi:outer membrane biosynthesis protein TonB
MAAMIEMALTDVGAKSGTSLAGGKGVSTRFPGIGLLSLVGLVVGAAGGYVALKTDAPAATEIVAAPIGPPIAEAPAPDAATPSSGVPVAEALVPRVESKPVLKPSTRATVKPTAEPSRPAATPDPTPASTPVTPAAPPPANDPPAPTPVPAAAEAPRYTPEPAVPTPAAATPEPREPEFDELTVARHSVIGIRLDAPISTHTARVEDRVTATVSRDVTVAGRTAIAAGVRLEGTVVLVERGGRFKTRPRLGLQFDRVILADGTRVNLKTDTIYREGDSPTADATAKVGTGAVAGAILGGMIGGKKGAVIGSAAGVAGGVATVMRGDGNEASLTAGAPLTVRLTEDVAILIKR